MKRIKLGVHGFYVYPDGWYANYTDDCVRCEWCEAAVTGTSWALVKQEMAHHREDCPKLDALMEAR